MTGEYLSEKEREEIRKRQKSLMKGKKKTMNSVIKLVQNFGWAFVMGFTFSKLVIKDWNFTSWEFYIAFALIVVLEQWKFNR